MSLICRFTSNWRLFRQLIVTRTEYSKLSTWTSDMVTFTTCMISANIYFLFKYMALRVCCMRAIRFAYVFVHVYVSSPSACDIMYK